MAVANKSYWRARAIEREAEYQAGSKATLEEVQKAYNRAFADIEKEIASIERQLDRQGKPGRPAAPLAAQEESVTDNYAFRLNKAFQMELSPSRLAGQ